MSDILLFHTYWYILIRTDKFFPKIYRDSGVPLIRKQWDIYIQYEKASIWEVVLIATITCMHFYRCEIVKTSKLAGWTVQIHFYLELYQWASFSLQILANSAINRIFPFPSTYILFVKNEANTKQNAVDSWSLSASMKNGE